MQKQNENAMNNFIFESIVHKFDENMNHNHDYLSYLLIFFKCQNPNF